MPNARKLICSIFAIRRRNLLLQFSQGHHCQLQGDLHHGLPRQRYLEGLPDRRLQGAPPPAL